jgi:hypothetical protein
MPAHSLGYKGWSKSAATTRARAEPAVKAQFCPIAADSANCEDRQSDSVKTIAQWSNKISILIMFSGKGFKSCGFMDMEKKMGNKSSACFRFFFFFFFFFFSLGMHEHLGFRV